MFVVLLMAVVGFLVGWRISTNVLGLIAALLLIVLAFAYSLSWLFAIVGLTVPDAETAQAASFPILAPLVFASSAFVPLELDAGLAPGLREAPAGDGACAMRPAPSRSAARRSATCIEALAWIVGIVVDLRAARRAQVPPSDLTPS